LIVQTWEQNPQRLQSLQPEQFDFHIRALCKLIGFEEGDKDFVIWYLAPKSCRNISISHSAVEPCFLDISISKSGPKMVCFVHVNFEMFFAPQRRAIFHLSSGQMAPHPPL